MPQRKRKRGRGETGVASGLTSASTAVTAEAPVDLTATLTPPASQTPVRPRRQPVTQDEWLARYAARAEARNAEARAQLIPLQPGERPWPILASVVVCGLAGLVNFGFWVAGAKIGGKPASTTEMIVFTLITGLCSAGMWVLWFQAVLAFMALLGIVVILFSLFLVEASNVLGVVVPLLFIFGGGFLFWKLVRVLARLQMPDRPARHSAAG